MSIPKRNWAVFALLACLLTACNATIAGTALKAPGAAVADGVDVALLNTGNFPTKALPPLGVAGNPRQGGLVEGRRMATNVVGPWEADPTLIGFEQFFTMPIKSTDGVNALLGKPLGEGLADYHFVAGFASGRHTRSGTYKRLVNVVLQMASPADAAAAAAAMAAKSAAISVAFATAPVATQPVAIPRYPGTTAVSYRYDDPTGPRSSVIAVTAHGSYVLGQAAESAVDLANATQMVATTLDLQQPRIDKFVPTPPDQLAQLPLDPSGLVARTLAPPPHGGTVVDGLYDQLGVQHLQDDPLRSEALFKSVGLQQTSYTVEVAVYQTGDSESATRIVADLAAEAVDFNRLRPTPGITGMPKAKCFAKPLGFYCVAGAEKYAIEVQAVHEDEAHQKVAAQYRILTGK